MSSWRPVLASVPQGSILNNLPNESQSSAKIFADDTSLFTIVKDKNEGANILNHDLLLSSKWTCNCKMPFNLDPKKPV